MTKSIGVQTDPLGDADELLVSWECLAKWSENAVEARLLQDEMKELKLVIKAYGIQNVLLQSKEVIEAVIQEFEEEKVKLKSHRQTMLKLNSRVHSWVTRQENELKLQQQLAPTTGSLADAAGQSEVERATDQMNIATAELQLKSESTVSVGIGMDKGGVQELQTAQCLNKELQLRLKDDVSDLYNSWDEAEARLNGQLVVLTSALQTWTQLEVGLGEFTDGLGKYRTLYELKDVLERGGVQLPNDTVMDVRQVSRLLTERIEAYQQTKPQDATYLHPSSAILYSLKSSSNGSLSDSGISDGGCGSDGGLSERERRLGSLRRLAKQLESNLAPGSAALETIYQRLEAAEDELKRLQELQETCREAVERLVRTSSPTGSAISSASAPLGNVEEELIETVSGTVKANESEEAVSKTTTTTSPGKAKRSSPPSKRKNKKRTSRSNSLNGKSEVEHVKDNVKEKTPDLEANLHVESAKVQERESNQKMTTWSGDAVEDPDTDDIDLLLLNNYQNYKKGTRNGYLLEDGIQELADDDAEEILLVKDDDPDDEFDDDSTLEDDSDSEDGATGKKVKKGWAWRVARIAVPLQFALISLFCMARLFEPQCCDVVNNFSMSFTPHLRYVRGPPPM